MAQDLHDELMRTTSLYAGDLRLRVDARNRLVVDHLSGERRIRQDILPLGHLDPASIGWDEQGSAIVLQCLPGRRQCMSTERFDEGTLSRSSYSTLPAPSNDPQGRRTITLLQGLVQAAHQQLVEVPNGTR